MAYYTLKKQKGTISINELTFVQSAKETLSSLLDDELKDKISLKSGKKVCKVTCLIDSKNKIIVNCEVFIVIGEDTNKIVELIQKEIYDDLYYLTEISNFKVNVLVLGFVNKKNDK